MGFGIVGEHFHDAHDIVLVFFKLGALFGVCNVLQCKGVDIEFFPDLLDQFRIVNAIYIEPLHHVRFYMGQTFIKIGEFLFNKFLFTVLDQRDLYFLRMIFTGVYYGTWREAGFVDDRRHNSNVRWKRDDGRCDSRELRTEDC